MGMIILSNHQIVLAALGSALRELEIKRDRMVSNIRIAIGLSENEKIEIYFSRIQV